MAGASFLRVNCNDCGNEAVVFSRASSVISCPVCGSTLAVPKGGKADLVGSSLTEILE
ncbi:MAG: 30S ribosomal protein S27e [Euryarchaeota archaeon]|nr:30S ribosomal protein S27e [Euryarchaeota archaeon]